MSAKQIKAASFCVLSYEGMLNIVHAGFFRENLWANVHETQVSAKSIADLDSFDTGHQYTLLEKAVAEILTTRFLKSHD